MELERLFADPVMRLLYEETLFPDADVEFQKDQDHRREWVSSSPLAEAIRRCLHDYTTDEVLVEELLGGYAGIGLVDDANGVCLGGSPAGVAQTLWRTRDMFNLADELQFGAIMRDVDLGAGASPDGEE